jgi:hypothetical protein
MNALGNILLQVLRTMWFTLLYLIMISASLAFAACVLCIVLLLVKLMLEGYAWLGFVIAFCAIFAVVWHLDI